jgi:hypothetical protein
MTIQTPQTFSKSGFWYKFDTKFEKSQKKALKSYDLSAWKCTARALSRSESGIQRANYNNQLPYIWEVSCPAFSGTAGIFNLLVELMGVEPKTS